MKLIKRSEWGARKAKSATKLHMTGPSTCHWNGTRLTVRNSLTWDHEFCPGIVRGIQNYHMDHNGWSDIAYNFLECPHGYTFEGRGMNVVNAGNGTNDGNRTSHAIQCMAGDGNPFTEEERVAFRETVALIAYLNKDGAQDAAKVHSDHKSTECPGDARRNWVHSGMPLAHAPSEVPSVPTPPAPPAKNGFANQPILKEGSVGDAVALAQRVIRDHAGGNITVDGKFGPQTKRRVMDLQRFFKFPPAEVDGIVGPKTWGLLYLINR